MEVLPIDIPQRLEFCEWLLNTLNNDCDTLSKVSLPIKRGFIRQDMRTQNMQIWNSENPLTFVETSLHPEIVGVWPGISRRRIIEPIFFEGNINAARCREEILQPFLEELHDDELQQDYFQQDGATPRCSHETLVMLREYFDDQVISQQDLQDLQDLGCYLTPCNFLLWPYIKNYIFTTPINHLDELRQCISDKIDELNNTPHILKNVLNAVKRRILQCSHVGGGHIHHLL